MMTRTVSAPNRAGLSIPKQTAIIIAFAIAGWAICGAPITFFVLSAIYHRRHGFTTPLVTSTIFVGVVLSLDVVVVAMLIERDFAMFRSVVGTWLPITFTFADATIMRVEVVGDQAHLRALDIALVSAEQITWSAFQSMWRNGRAVTAGAAARWPRKSRNHETRRRVAARATSHRRRVPFVISWLFRPFYTEIESRSSKGAPVMSEKPPGHS